LGGKYGIHPWVDGLYQAVANDLAQMSMHAANESAGVHDLGYMARAMRAYHETEIDVVCDGIIRMR
jgi:hypothetical protein